MSMDCTYRLRIPHEAGQLAQVATLISEHRGLIGDVQTITVARLEAIREITVELRDKDHADELAAALGELPGVSVVWYHDRAFIAHMGGKLEVRPRKPITTNQEVRDVYTPGSRACPPRSTSTRSWRALHDDRPQRRDLHQRQPRARAR